MGTKPKSIDDYLARVRLEQRAALERLRKTIRAAARDAEESFSYGLPAFRLNGKPLVAFSASSKHCSFFPMDSTTVAAHKELLKGFDTSKGTVRFTSDQPLPAAVVRKMVQARIAAIGQSAKQPSKSRPSRDELAVVAFLSNLKHPLKAEIETIRQIILGVSPTIREAIKWNAPSFRISDDFAMLNLRNGRVWLILHTGAKTKGKSMRSRVADPDGLLKWLADDRALVTFTDAKQIREKQRAFSTLLRAWIRAL
jgi:uncharacterized protein YdhG (YjbR/CyaY superfamily)